MSRAFFSLVILFNVCASFAAEPSRFVCFERGSDIWIAKLDGTGAQKITKGTSPDMSSDGTRIAFNTNGSKNNDILRQIAIADVATKQVKIFTGEIPSENCYNAIWSPDAVQILFNIWTESDWHLAVINADGSGFRYVKKANPKNNSFNSACWAPDGHSIYAQDLNKLYQFSLEGKELQSWSLKSLFPKGSFSSDSYFAVSPDGKTLLMEVDMDDDVTNMPDWDGPPLSLWTLDIASRKATRLTPKGLFAWHGCWLDATRILFASQLAKEKQPSICEMTVTEKNRKPILKNANNPTVSRQAGE